MSRFKGEGSKNYNQRISKLIPGYELLHQLTAAKLNILLPRKANILVVGAGTGNEILKLSKINKSWQFTALDPSKDMLDIAYSRFKENGIEQRVKYHNGTIESFKKTQKFDVALCFYVMHFIQTLSDKENLLKSIRDHLKPKADLLIADLMKPLSDNDRLAQGEVSQMMGLTAEEAENMLSRLSTDFYPLNRDELTSLIKTAGFQDITPYFQALRFSAFHIAN